MRSAKATKTYQKKLENIVSEQSQTISLLKTELLKQKEINNDLIEKYEVGQTVTIGEPNDSNS